MNRLTTKEIKEMVSNGDLDIKVLAGEKGHLVTVVHQSTKDDTLRGTFITGSDERLDSIFTLVAHNINRLVEKNKVPTYHIKGNVGCKHPSLDYGGLTAKELHEYTIPSFDEEYKDMLIDIDAMRPILVFGRNFKRSEIVEAMMKDTLIDYVNEKIENMNKRLAGLIAGGENEFTFLGYTITKEDN